MLDRYEAAINARSLPQLKAAYPGLKPDQETQWKDLFSNDIEQLSGSIAVLSIKDLGDLAEAAFRLTLNFKPKRDVRQTVRVAGTATFRMENGVWRMITVSSRPE